HRHACGYSSAAALSRSETPPPRGAYSGRTPPGEAVMSEPLQANARRILRDIDPSAWEHPADRAALEAARRIPVFDTVLRTIFGLFGERAIRLAFQANAVRVGPRQFPEVWDHYLEVCQTLDVKDPPELSVSQTPLVNAGASGMNRPFFVM